MEEDGIAVLDAWGDRGWNIFIGKGRISSFFFFGFAELEKGNHSLKEVDGNACCARCCTMFQKWTEKDASKVNIKLNMKVFLQKKKT